jgi:hypothetical protein
MILKSDSEIASSELFMKGFAVNRSGRFFTDGEATQRKIDGSFNDGRYL